MDAIYGIAVWLHLVCAAVWLGGMVFIAAVLVPTIREPAFAPHAAALVSRIGVRFRAIAWLLIALLLLTGTMALAHRGVGITDLFSGAAWTGPFGNALRWKLSLVGVVIGLSLFHDFVVGPRASKAARAAADAPQTLRLRSRARLLGRTTLVITLAIVALGAYLARS